MTNKKNIIPDYDLLAKYFAGETSVSQTREIEKWVSDNAEHKKTYDRIHFLWMQSAKDKLEEKVDVNSAWTKMQFKMNAAKRPKASASEPKKISIYKKTTYRLLQFAAIIIIALGINVLIKYLNSDVNYISAEAQLSVVDVKLPDNSEIKLNKESKISYPEEFKGKERNVKLEGEAFFEVEPDKEKPFVIEANFAKIKVLGTSFNIQAYDTSNIVEVTVVSGVVELSDIKDPSNKITLEKGERGIINKLTGKPDKEEYSEEEEVFGVVQQTIVFKDTELYMVAETLERAYNIEIDIINENTKHCTWSVTFNNQPIEVIMNLLEGSFKGLTVDKTDRKYIINGTSCE